MAEIQNTSVLSNTDNPASSIIPTPINTRPLKIQKLQIPIPSHFEFGSTSNSTFTEDTNSGDSCHNQETPEPAQNQNKQQPDYNYAEENTTDPFCYYQDSHIQDSIDQCTNSIIGKILADKPITNQILFNSLSGIWCNPAGLKISELEGKIFQIKMDKEEDIQRILKGNPWIIRNCWLLLHNWNRNLDISTLDFTQVPLWIQFWGLPLHCKSITMGQEMGSQLGKVMDVGIYEFPEKAKIVKVKVLININHPIRAGMFIGNDNDGINWVDFRFENLPMFCFGCGLIGHNLENCRNSPIPLVGGTNPRGAWLRTKNFGHRIHERKEKTFSSNPLRSISGGQFSPLPKGLLDKMATINLNRHSPQNAKQSPTQYSPQTGSTKLFTHKEIVPIKNMEIQHMQKTTTHSPRNSKLAETKNTKRKLGYFGTTDAAQEKNLSINTEMAGLSEKASQHQ